MVNAAGFQEVEEEEEVRFASNLGVGGSNPPLSATTLFDMVCGVGPGLSPPRLRLTSGRRMVVVPARFSRTFPNK